MSSLLRRHGRLVGVVLFLALLLVIFEVSGLRGHWNLAYLHDQLLGNPRTGLLLFVLLFSLGNLIQIPGWIFLGAAVLALGQTMGGIASYIAANVSCTVTFLLIRFLGGDALRGIKNKTLVHILERLDSHPILGIALTRILFQTLPALNYALAMSGVKLRSYVVGTLLGLPLPIALYCVFFDYLAAALHIK